MTPILLSVIIICTSYGSWILANAYYVDKYYMIPRGFYGEEADERIQRSELGFTLVPTDFSGNKTKLKVLDGGKCENKKPTS